MLVPPSSDAFTPPRGARTLTLPTTCRRVACSCSTNAAASRPLRRSSIARSEGLRSRPPAAASSNRIGPRPYLTWPSELAGTNRAPPRPTPGELRHDPDQETVPLQPPVNLWWTPAPLHRECNRSATDGQQCHRRQPATQRLRSSSKEQPPEPPAPRQPKGGAPLSPWERAGPRGRLDRRARPAPGRLAVRGAWLDRLHRQRDLRLAQDPPPRAGRAGPSRAARPSWQS